MPDINKVREKLAQDDEAWLASAASAGVPADKAMVLVGAFRAMSDEELELTLMFFGMGYTTGYNDAAAGNDRQLPEEIK